MHFDVLRASFTFDVATPVIFTVAAIGHVGHVTVVATPTAHRPTPDRPGIIFFALPVVSANGP